MNTTTTVSIKPFLLTAAAAVLCTGLQFNAVDALAAPRSARAEAVVQQLPTVLVTAKREGAAPTSVQQLPQVVVVGRRLDRAADADQALNATAGSAT